MEVGAIDVARKRCKSVINTIEQFPSNSVISVSLRRTLLKLASSELSFLSSIATDPTPQPLSVNIGHLESVLFILQLPSVTSVSRVCKPLPILDGGVHVDIVCTLGNAPVWILVSDRNPRYISWSADRHGGKGLKSRIDQVLISARSTTTLRPSSVIMFFANGLPSSIYEKLTYEFGAVDFKFGSESSLLEFDSEEEQEEGWVNVIQTRSYRDAIAVEIKLTDSYDSPASPELNTGIRPGIIELSRNDAFSSLLSSLRLQGDVQSEDSLVNFDTTALVALVSGISNGCTERILATSEADLKTRFKGNTEFVIAQVRSELQNPVFEEMGVVLSGKRGIVCQSAAAEFNELVSMYGGLSEKGRAQQLLKCLVLVGDNPSERVGALPTTRKLAKKNKVVFGTGDSWRAPTITANKAFARAVAQTGMSLATFHHSPRALTGD